VDLEIKTVLLAFVKSRGGGVVGPTLLEIPLGLGVSRKIAATIYGIFLRSGRKPHFLPPYMVVQGVDPCKQPKKMEDLLVV
jgi:hypothetical protein